MQYISRLHEILDGHYKTQSTLFAPDETLDLHLIICGDAAAPTCASTISDMMIHQFLQLGMQKLHVTICRKKYIS